MAKPYLRILKLIPGRDARRLKLIWKGHEELNSFMGISGRSAPELIRWGLLYRLPTVHGLDAYGGLRPTKSGVEYFIHDEEFHLILVRKEKAEELRERSRCALNIQLEASSVNFGYQMELAVKKGFRYVPPDKEFLTLQRQAEQRYVKRGFLPLDVFRARYDLSFDTLVVAGVLRYLDRKDPEKIAAYVVGAKAKTLLLMSTRWQLTFVRPGMVEQLLELCKVDLCFVFIREGRTVVWIPA